MSHGCEAQRCKRLTSQPRTNALGAGSQINPKVYPFQSFTLPWRLQSRLWPLRLLHCAVSCKVAGAIYRGIARFSLPSVSQPMSFERTTVGGHTWWLLLSSPTIIAGYGSPTSRSVFQRLSMLADLPHLLLRRTSVGVVLCSRIVYSPGIIHVFFHVSSLIGLCSLYFSTFHMSSLTLLSCNIKILALSILLLLQNLSISHGMSNSSKLRDFSMRYCYCCFCCA